ncbi:MAG: hypothetical protein F4Y02_09040 [Chloroflexi bacterium]|nr:hypothetical protein [Chloroflexota bacterium]
MAVFDTLRAARTLKAAGFGDAKAEAVAEIVQAVANGNRVSKVDLRDFATKADLERFATKEDLERFATKEDLKSFATKADLERFASKAELQDLELRLTIRMGVIAASSVTIATALTAALSQLLL